MTQFIIIMAVALGLGVVAIIVCLVVAVKRASERKAAERDRALEAQGLQQLDEETIPGALAWVGSLKKLSGGVKNITRAWSGEWEGRPVECVQHRYVVSTGQTTAVIQHRLAALPVPTIWPDLQLGEENIFTRIGSAIAGEDLQLEDEAFNKRWRIRTKDEAFTILLLSPELQQHLRQAPRGQQWFIIDGRLILMESGEYRPDDPPRMLKLLLEFHALIPSELEYWQPEVASRAEEETVDDVLRIDDDER
ncbi:MAG: hypothetical protein ACF8NJ_10235 [Phycisphaerales bacterium JB038]